MADAVACLRLLHIKQRRNSGDINRQQALMLQHGGSAAAGLHLLAVAAQHVVQLQLVMHAVDVHHIS
jgi:hypothetical protein